MTLPIAPAGRRLVTRAEAAERLACRPDTVTHRAIRAGIQVFQFDPRANRGYLRNAGSVRPGTMVVLESDLPRLAERSPRTTPAPVVPDHAGELAERLDAFEARLAAIEERQTAIARLLDDALEAGEL